MTGLSGFGTVVSGADEERPAKTRIFISGGISGIPDYKYNFQQARYKLHAAGYEVEDPSLNVGEPGWGWEQWMKQSIAQMLTCDGVAMLPGYQYSRGALVEMHLANDLRMDVRTVDEWTLERMIDHG